MKVAIVELTGAPEDTKGGVQMLPPAIVRTDLVSGHRPDLEWYPATDLR